MNDDKLAIDEEQRVAQHEAVKEEVRGKVHAEISRQADEVTPQDRATEDAVASSLKQKAVREVASTEAELERDKTIARGSQVLDYVFYLIYGLIAMEVLLEAIGASQAAGFKQFIDALSAPLLAPFRGLLPNPTVGRYEFRIAYIVALVAYMLLHMAMNGLLRLFVHHKTEV
jgi:uncharacterized protein YggT (Ycf19 family)